MSLLQNSNAIETGGYAISNSLRFQSASSTYLARTPASAGSQTTWTWSCWVKRGALGLGRFLSAGSALSDQFGFNSSDNFQFVSDTTAHNLVTTQVFRDPSALYHIVVAFDTTQATAANRIKLYVNGTQVTAFSTATYPAQNSTTLINGNTAQNIGRRLQTGGEYFDGYMTEINFVNAQALTPSDFGQTDTLTGQWVAKKYTGTYGTNGFYLPFSNGTSTTTLGADSSGNSNNWTLNNFTRSAGTSDCWMIDVPSGNSGASATQPSSNYSILNPLSATSGSTTISAGNINVSLGTSGQWRTVANSMVIPTTGSWYWEITKTNTTTSGDAMIGIYATDQSFSGNTPLSVNLYGYGYWDNGQKVNNGSGTAYGSSWTNNDVIGVAFNSSTGQLTFYKNNVSQGVAFTVSSTKEYYAVISGANTPPSFAVNFGQRSFAYTPPTGFKALCTANLPAATIKQGNQYMDATTYTGNGSTLSVTNAGGFSPDFVWIKDRAVAQQHLLYDTIRGVYNFLSSNTTTAESTNNQTLTAFNSNGFSLGTNGTSNSNGGSFVAWQWDAGSSTVTNTNGSISSQVRANPTCGVSVVTYTGNATTNSTVGHGLGVAPAMMIFKRRDAGGNNWTVYHKSLGIGQYIYLNSTAAAGTYSGYWNGVAPTSSVFNLSGINSDVNGSGATYVAYCFAEIAGFSKFGSYTGNGSSDGPFIYLGFRPKFVMIKRTDTAGFNWLIYDSVRNTYNVTDLYLSPNSANAEASGITFPSAIDILSNGFKTRNYDATYGPTINANGGTYIYACFAESPFASSNAR